MRWLFCIALLGVACRSSGQIVPPYVHPLHSAGDFHFPKSPLFVRLPPGFIFDDSASAVVGEGARISIDYFDGFSYQGFFGPIFHKMDSTMDHQDFQMGPYPAHIDVYSVPLGGSLNLFMEFGDSAFTVRVSAIIAGIRESAKKKVLDILLSMYIDQAKAMKVPSNAPFSLDLGHSWYGFYSIYENYYSFTVGGARIHRAAPYFMVFIPTTSDPLANLKSSMDSITRTTNLRYLTATHFTPLSGGRWEVTGTYSRVVKYYGVTAGPLVFFGFYTEDSSLVTLKRIASSLKIK